jgi:PadR family transcriptional regulator PadR
MTLARDLFLGFVKLHVLYHAGQEPVYGLWLIRELAHHGYELSPGTLYPMLQSLEEDGLLHSEQRVVAGKVRRYYALTDEGDGALVEGRAKARELLAEIEQDAVQT